MKPDSLIIMGKSDTGKTHLAVAIANKLIENDKTVLMERLTNLSSRPYSILKASSAVSEADNEHKGEKLPILRFFLANFFICFVYFPLILFSSVSKQ